MALHGITVCLDLTHPSSEINKSPKPGIERELVWFAIDRRPLRPRLASFEIFYKQLPFFFHQHVYEMINYKYIMFAKMARD